MKTYPVLLRTITLTLLLAANQSFAQSLDRPAYCPDTLTDTDDDGWGTENGSPCRVLRSANIYPVCFTTTQQTDPDHDGWGWSSEGTCFVDNVSVEKTYTITDASGNVTTGGNAAPIVGGYVKSLGHITSAMAISTDGTMYHFRIPPSTIAASDIDGTTLWEVKINNDYVRELILDKAEQSLLAVMTGSGSVASYSTGGALNWQSAKLGRVSTIETGQNAIIIGLANETDLESNQLVSAVSLNLDGTLRWKFEPPAGNPIGALALGKDNLVYIKYTSNPYGNDTTLILAQ